MFIFLRNTARYDIMALILIDVFAVHCVLKTKKKQTTFLMCYCSLELSSFYCHLVACTTVVSAKEARSVYTF